jgi:Collagen triple helix repeat (20 copies)
MTALVLRWRQPDPPIVTRWRGVDAAMLASVARDDQTPVAAVIGPPGAPGATGAAGAAGAAGPQGPAGATGPAGAAGATGLVGITGPTGAPGAAGAQGSQGPQGVSGTTGPVGATGPAGVAGPTGATGATGGPGLPATLTVVEVDLGSARRSGRFVIGGLAGLTAGRAVAVSQATGPYTGKGTLADEAEMDAIDVAASVTSATQITAFWKSRTRVRGNHRFSYQIGG